MDPSNFKNNHENLGVGNNSPTNTHAPQDSRDITNNTISSGPTPREISGGPEFERNRGTAASSSCHSPGHEAKAQTAMATEIGDPNGRIPTAEDTKNQLAAARNSDLPVGPSKTAQHYPEASHLGHPASGVPTTERAHRNSNYAPGYEDAANAVRPKSYNAEEHRPSLLAHEPATPASELPPNLGNASENDSAASGSGMFPGPSISQKA